MKKILPALLLTFLLASPVLAVEVAPRISDREIVEKLSALDAKIDKRYGELDAKIDKRYGELDAKIDKRYGELDAKIDRVDAKIDKEIANVRGDIKELKAGQNALQQQINDLKESNNKRFDTLQWLLSLFITVALSIMGIMGKILWNQQKKMTQIETSLEAQKEELSFVKSLIEKLQTLIEKLLPPRGVL